MQEALFEIQAIRYVWDTMYDKRYRLKKMFKITAKKLYTCKIVYKKQNDAKGDI